MSSDERVVLRIVVPSEHEHPLRVQVRREDLDVDYGWVRVDELPDLIAGVIPPATADGGVDHP